MGGQFLRAQCQTGRLRAGCVVFNTVSVRANTGKVFTRGYIGEAELFLVFCPETDQIYAVPVDEAPAAVGMLRVEPTRDGQKKGIRWARDYELPG